VFFSVQDDHQLLDIYFFSFSTIQTEDLPRILTIAVTVLAPVAESGLDSRMSAQQYEAISVFFSVAEKALSWSFTPKNALPGVFEDPSEPSTTLQPPATWAELFTGERSIVELFFNVCRALLVVSPRELSHPIYQFPLRGPLRIRKWGFFFSSN
jgi:hypothetical protein